MSRRRGEEGHKRWSLHRSRILDKEEGNDDDVSRQCGGTDAAHGTAIQRTLVRHG